MKNLNIIVFLFCNSVNGQWVQQNSSTNLAISSVYFVNPVLGYASCAGYFQGLILKTTNGGTNWASIYTGFNYDYTSICFSNENTGYLVDVLGHILKTTNGGTNWIQLIYENQGQDLAAIEFPDSLNGYTAGGVTGGEGFIYKTTNAGNTWTWVNSGSGTYYEHYCMDFLNANTGYIGGRVSLTGIDDIIKTTNGGANWSRRVSLTGSIITGISFCNPDTGYAVSSQGEVIYTSNGGVNWNHIGIFPYTLTCVKTFNLDTAYIAGTHNFIARTVNNGITWETQTPYLPGWNASVWAMFFPNDTIGYAVGDSGKILITTDAGVIGIQPVSTIVPKTFTLYQNYPNPFNPETKIKVDIAKSSYTKLIIYDVIGRENAMLIDGQLTAGKYEVKWNAANFPSGLYFCRLETETFTKVMKMVLLK